MGDFYIKILQISSFDNKKYSVSSASGGRFNFVTENRTHNLCINVDACVMAKSEKKKRVSTQEKSDFAIARRFSKRKYWSCAQT